jgi:hypothetical protein
MTKFFSFLSLLLATNSNAQIDSAIINDFERLSRSPGYQNLNYEYFETKIDSVKVSINYNPNLASVQNYFMQSGRSLSINFYFKKGSLFFITTSQECPAKPDLLYVSRYYIVENKISQEEHSSSRPIALGIPLSKKDLQERHYCPNIFHYDFLEKYILILLAKLNKPG